MHIPWLTVPSNHDLIARWTPEPRDFELALPAPADPARFQFLVLGDTGDSEATGRDVTPQDAVARQLAADARLGEGTGRGELVLHVGDVVYMTGERRLYDRNFRRPYAAFLTPDSTFESLVFRLPFLPVPGNHDYYDFPAWASLVARLPGLGTGLRAIARELFAFSIPQGGSGMGRVYMDAFVDGNGPAAYQPGARTRLPNRYYRFRFGSVDFFALDSNTLDAFRPTVDESGVRRDAARSVGALEAKAREIDAELRREEEALTAKRDAERRLLAADPTRRRTAADAARAVAATLSGVVQAVAGAEDRECRNAGVAATRARSRWLRHLPKLGEAVSESRARRALGDLDRAVEETNVALCATDECLVHRPEGPARAALLLARESVEAALRRWLELSFAQPPAAWTERSHALSEAALDVQRALARERQRMRYRVDDYDAGQLEWLERSLERSIRERPDGWRIAYFHHPLFTSISTYCENSEIREIRDNLRARLEGRVHAVFCGHAHAFEWLRSRTLPGTGLFIVGGGGQVRLGRSVADPRRWERTRRRYQSLREAGVVELVNAGRGPGAPDGERGSLYSYVRVEVTPEVLRIVPIGVRRVEGGYRREEPMPAWHVPELPTGQPPWETQRLLAVEVRRDGEPRAVWA